MPRHSHPAVSPGNSAKRWRDELKEQGLVKIEMWIPPDMKPTAKQIEQALRARAIISAAPFRPFPNREIKLMPNVIETPWTIHALHAALRESPFVTDGEATLELVSGADPILQVTMLAYGNLPIYVSVNGEQILASVLLWPVAEQPDPAAFNTFILKTHKVLPLSTFGITTIDRVDYYELFGALSARAAIGEVVTELHMLASNTIDVAELRDAA